MSAEVKPGYKMTEVGVIPEDWEVRSLGELAIVRDGTHQTPRYQASGVPFYSVEHVTSGDFFNTKFISEQEHQFLTRSFKIEKGDILMTRIGSIGECKLIDWDVRASFYVSLALLKIRGASAEYIVQYSKSSEFKSEIELHSLQHATPKKINLGPISDIKISLPPTEAEQQAIASLLSEMDALISSLDQLIAKKRDLKQAAMQQLLTGQKRLPGFSGEWELTRLGSMVSLARISIFPFMNPEKLFAHFSLPAFDEGKEPAIEPGSYIASNKFSVPEGAVLVSKLNPRIPRIWMPVAQEHEAVASTEFLVLLPKSAVIREFLYELCRSDGFCAQLEISATGTTGSHQRISPAAALDIEVSIPSSLDEQTAIATILSDMSAEVSALEARREKARQLKQGMMQELLTGRIRLV